MPNQIRFDQNRMHRVFCKLNENTIFATSCPHEIEHLPVECPSEGERQAVLSRKKVSITFEMTA